MRNRLRPFARVLLRLAERFFLFAYGWKAIGNDNFLQPVGYENKQGPWGYRGGHALNSQKYYLHHQNRRRA